MMPKILVTGRNGQVGFELCRTLACLGQVHAVGRETVDFADTAAVRQLVRSLKPDILVNAAAYTDVNRAESEPAIAQTINGEVPGILGEELRRAGGKLLVHYSTDYVFSGEASRPYTEDDPTGPINAYGATKLAGELAIRSSGCPHLILRTAWVYSTRGNNFLLTILRAARMGKPLRVVADQAGAPTWARMLAEATASLLARLAADELDQRSGVYHLQSSGETTWHEFTQTILDTYARRLAATGSPADWCRAALAELKAIPSSEYVTPARRPAYSVLNTAKLERAFGLRFPDWRDQLARALEDYPNPVDTRG